MATLNAVIRWADNTAQLQQNLKEGLDQIEATRASAEKMIQALSGERLIAAAHKYAAAIQEIGGVEKLTSAEKVRINGLLDQALEKYTALGKVAPDALKQLHAATMPAVQSTSTLAEWFGRLGTQVVTTMAGFVSAQAIIGMATRAWDLYVGFLKDSVKAFAEAEAAQVKLTAALKAQHTATPELIDQYNQLATEFQRTTVYSDDLVTSMQALLVQVGGIMPSQMKEALQASADLASGLGIDLQQATMLVAKAAAGHTETLGRYGVTVSDAALRTKGFDAVLEAINRQFGGQAAAQIQTHAGQVAQMGNAWDNVKEAAGKFILQNPIINAGLRTITEKLKSADTGTTEWSGSLATLADQGHLKGYAKIIGWIEDYLDRLNQVEVMNKRLADMPSPFAKTAEEMAKFPDPGGLAYFKAVNDAEDAQHKLDVATKKTILTEEEAGLKRGLMVGATMEETEALINLAGVTDTWGLGIGQLNQVVPDLTGHIEMQKQMFADTRGELLPLVTVFDDYDQQLRAAQQAEASLQKTHELLARTMGPVVTGIADMNHRLPETTQKVGALTRGFEAVEGVLGGVQTKFAQLAVVAARTAEAMIEKFGSGDWIGGIVAGVAGGIQLITSLFHDAEKAINGTRAAFVDAAGGLDALRDKATEAGVTINALLNAKNAEQYKAAIDALNLAFNEHAADIDRAKELIDEYGLSIEQLGPAWRAQQLDEQVTGLMDDLRIMVDVLGLSMPDALTVMAGKFQAAFDTALKFGIELPPQMQPVLQQMIDLGLLVDANGNKYTTLEGTGVKFSETFSGAVDRLIAKFDEFLKGIGLSPSIADRAAEGIESGLNRIHPSPIHVQVVLDWPNVPPSITVPASVAGVASGGLVTAHGIQHLSTGGRVLAFTPRGTDTVPAMLTPGEEVIPVGGRAKEMAPVVAAINKLGRDLPQQLAVAVRDEVQKKVGRR